MTLCERSAAAMARGASRYVILVSRVGVLPMRCLQISPDPS